jgi:hypothetical protein
MGRLAECGVCPQFNHKRTLSAYSCKENEMAVDSSLPLKNDEYAMIKNIERVAEIYAALAAFKTCTTAREKLRITNEHLIGSRPATRSFSLGNWR